MRVLMISKTNMTVYDFSGITQINFANEQYSFEYGGETRTFDASTFCLRVID